MDVMQSWYFTLSKILYAYINSYHFKRKVVINITETCTANGKTDNVIIVTQGSYFGSILLLFTAFLLSITYMLFY